MTIETFSKLARHNRDALMSNRDCSCYFCIRHFSTDQITDWIDRSRTALCPNCDVDALVPGKVEISELTKAFEHYFTGGA